MACDYSTKFLPLLVAYNADPTLIPDGKTLEEWIKQSFNDGQRVYTRWMAGTLLTEGSTSTPSVVENRPYFGRFTYETQYDNISDFYRGATELQIQAEQAFKQDIVRLAVFDITQEDAEQRWKNPTATDDEGIAAINRIIAKYKEELANKLLMEVGNEQPITLDSSLSNSAYNKIIQDVLAKYRQFLSTNPESVANYDAFVTLSVFDEMLQAYAPFIQPKKAFIDPVSKKTLKTDAFDKYEYKGPNVEHYTGYTSSEFAAIENQDSDLAKILLDTIPDIGENGERIPGSFIGLSGFNASMTAMKNWIMYSHDATAQEARKEYYKGAKADFAKIIDLYLNHLKIASKATKGVYDSRSTFLISKLKSIGKYIFDPKSDYIMRAMFANMVFKTENISYRAYAYDETSGRVSGSNLRNAYVNAQKFNVEDIVRSAEHLVRSSQAQRDNITSKYRVSYNKGSILIQDVVDYNKWVAVTLAKKGSEIKGAFTGASVNDDAFKKAIIQDFLMYIVPDTYVQVGQSLEDPSWSWADDFAPMVAAIGHTLTKTSNSAIERNNRALLEFKNWTAPILKIAKKLSVIYGSETRNVVKNLSGSNLPSYQLTNLSYNLPAMIDDVIADQDSVNKDSLLIKARQLLIAPQVRSEVRFGDKTKSAADLSVRELLQLNVIHDFYEAFLPNSSEPGKVYLQSATYADKSTHYLFGYDLNQTIEYGGRKYNLFELIKGLMSDGNYTDPQTRTTYSAQKELLDIIRLTRANRINNIVANILEDYRSVFPEAKLDTLSDLQTFLNGKKYKDIVAAFEKSGVEFFEEVHGTKPRYNGAPNIALNETLVMQYETFNNAEKFNQRLNKSREAFIASIDEAHWKWNKYDNPIFKDIFDNNKFEDFRGQNGYVELHKDGKLHPILEAYFLTDVLLSNEVNSLLIGEVFAHPNKNRRQTNTDPELGEVGTYEEFSEANRLIAQIKRSVAFGATWHPYLQGLNNGVASQIRVAVVEDLKGIVFTPNGDENDDLDSMDGSGVAHPIQSRFENNSLVDAKVGANKKSIMMDVNTRLGLPTLLKWAVYELSNEVRRNGYFSNASAEQLYRKMSLGDLSVYVSVDQLNEALQKYGDVFFKSYKDFSTGENAVRYYRIEGFEKTGSEIRQKLVQVDPQTGQDTQVVVNQPVPLTSLYDFDQALGGAFTGKFENGEWIYNEANLDILEGLLSTTSDNRKSTFVSYVVNKSAIKVGAGAVNPSSVWSRDDVSDLNYFWMQTKYGGVQMDADHELDLAEVTEMTQMISALIEDGHYKDLVESVYKDIGGVVASHMAKLNSAIANLLETGSYEAKQELYKILAQSWINSFEKGDKDTIGIAQAFVKKVSDAFKRGDYTAQIPFSAATINGSFVSNVISSINKGGIRHKYEGFAGVLNPSHNMIQYYRVWNDRTNDWEVRLFDEFAEYCLEKGIPVNAASIEALQINGQLNPLLKELPNGRIDFEDTIVITDADGNIVAIETDEEGNPVYSKYINSFQAYDDMKAFLRKNPTYRTWSHTGFGKNLKGTNTWFTVNGKEYSIYDLDSVRTSQYLWKVLSQSTQEKFEKALNSIPVEKLATIQRTLGWRFDYDFLKANPIAAKQVIAKLIKRSNAKTQEILKAIEKGEEFEASEAFGIVNPTVTEDGSPIQYTSAHLELQALGTRKNVDTESTIAALQNPAIASENPTVATWLIKVLQDHNAIENPVVGLTASIKAEVDKVKTLKNNFERMRANDPEFSKWTVGDRARAATAYYDALHNLIARICDQVFDIDVKWNLRRLSSGEVKTSWSVRADSYRVDAAEVITGRYQWEKFGLGENDHIFNINSSADFYHRIREKYTTPSDINEDLFDVVMYGQGEQFLIKFGELPEIQEGILSESKDFVEIDGNVYFNGVKVGSAQNKLFWTYTDETGGKHTIIQLGNPDDFRELRRSSVFDNVIHYFWNEDNFETLKNVKFGNREQTSLYTTTDTRTNINVADLTLDEAITDEEIRFDNRMQKQADELFDSFKKQGLTVGARIPTQAMQSFMAMKTIAVTKVKKNSVYVPKSQTYLEGSMKTGMFEDYINKS